MKNPKAAQARQRGRDPKRKYIIFCDESGIHHSAMYGFGSLWMPWERRGDFARIWSELQDQFYPPSEVKWHKVKRQTLDFYLALIDEFFRRRWLMFHCLVVGKAEVELQHHKKDWDLARRKQFVMLLSNKLARFATPKKEYRIRVDPIASRYSKADEAAEIIIERIVSKKPRLQGVIHSLREVDSRDTPGVQLSDLLLGAVMAARVGEARAHAKLAVIERICSHLGWDSLAYDTKPDVIKFNIWRFWDPTSGEPRPETTERRILADRVYRRR